jgi:uncharacterized protein DUF6599
MNVDRLIWSRSVLLVSFLLAGCMVRGQPDLPAPQKALPPSDAVPGWSKAQQDRTYDQDTLFDFMNGAAELYFTYGFESLAVGMYENAAGKTLRLEVYRTATDADAYGLYAYSAYGDPLDIGTEGRRASGIGLFFWQHRTFVQIGSRDPIDDADLQAFGEAVVSALPQAGTRPALVDALPTEGLQPESVRFFHEQMALENFLWLGTENVLGLGPETEGIVAEYVLEDQLATLLIVTFPQTGGAQDARLGLERVGMEELVLTLVQGNAMGAIFGQLAPEIPAALLDQALAALQ